MINIMYGKKPVESRIAGLSPSQGEGSTRALIAGRTHPRERGLCQATIKPSCRCPEGYARSPASWSGCSRRVGAAVVRVAVPEAVRAVIFAM
jgi:hypothetical protein